MISNYWILCEEVSVTQAAMLLINVDPAELVKLKEYVEDVHHANLEKLKLSLYNMEELCETVSVPNFLKDPADWIKDFEAAFNALAHLVKSKKIKANVHYLTEIKWDCIAEQQYEEPTNKIDFHRTTINVDDLRKWLASKGATTSFFFPKSEGAPDYLDKTHKNYAPKLAAAIGAWEAVNGDPELIKGRTVKQALLKWLQNNADQFGLTKDDGNPNMQGIREIAKISNWDYKGGAPKTPE